MTQYRSNRGRGGGGGNIRKGAKDLSKNRFAAFDADILSNYDDVEDEPLRKLAFFFTEMNNFSAVPRNRPRVERDIRNRPGPGISMRGTGNGSLTSVGRIRNDRTQFLSAGGKNAEIVNKVKVSPYFLLSRQRIASF